MGAILHRSAWGGTTRALIKRCPVVKGSPAGLPRRHIDDALNPGLLSPWPHTGPIPRGSVTSPIRLATLATAVGYRNPAHLAKIAASVDLISRGRLTLGIGAGFFEDEYRQYGWEFPPQSATRIRQMEEAVQLILKMWTEPRTTFHGRYFHVEDAILEPKPVQKPRPPVMIAGGGEQLTLRAVARLADACNVSGDPEIVRRKLGILRGHCDTAQRDYNAIEKTHNNSWLLARDEAAV